VKKLFQWVLVIVVALLLFSLFFAALRLIYRLVIFVIAIAVAYVILRSFGLVGGNDSEDTD